MKLFKILIPAVLIGGLILVAGNYHLVRTADGYHLIEKKSFGFGEMMVDTRDWTPMDWLKNKNISLGLASEKWQKFKGKVSDGWNDFSDDLEDQIDKLDLEDTSEDVKKKLTQLRKASKEKYDDLSKKLEKQEIDWDTFTKKLDELNAWTRKEVEKIQKRFE